MGIKDPYHDEHSQPVEIVEPLLRSTPGAESSSSLLVLPKNRRLLSPPFVVEPDRE